MTACCVSRCGSEATVTVTFPHSGTWHYCQWHGRPFVQYQVRRPA